MSTISKIIQRNDATSVVVAAVVAFLTFQFVVQITAPLANRIGVPSDVAQPITGADFYVPAAAFALQLLALELLLTLTILARAVYKKPVAKKK